MRKLLLFALMATPAVASAQWNGTVFPDSAGRSAAVKRQILRAHDNPHGIAVDGEGKIWIQPYYPRSGDSVSVPVISTTAKQMSGAIYVFKADGTPADFSPILFLDYPGGARDTVGGSVIRNSTGGQIWAQIGGRGLAADQNGDIIATFTAATNTNNIVRVSKINHLTGQGIAKANMIPYGLDYRGPGAPAVDGLGRVYATGIFPGDAMLMLNPDLTFRENVATADIGFTRASGVSMTGDSVYHMAYDKKYVLRYVRPDEFAPFRATADTVLRGIASESFARHPINKQQVWFGGGSPNDVPVPPYFRSRWYAFNESELGQAFPTKRDSIVWTETASQGRPRGMAFSPDGTMAYVIQFSNVSEPFGVRRYTKITNAVDGYGRWVPDDVLLTVGPNPSRGALNVRYRGLAGTAVRIELFDAAGRRVASLVDGVQPDGEQTTSFDTSSLSAGTYYVRFTGGNATVTRPVSVLH